MNIASLFAFRHNLTSECCKDLKKLFHLYKSADMPVLKFVKPDISVKEFYIFVVVIKFLQISLITARFVNLSQQIFLQNLIFWPLPLTYLQIFLD